jgi:nitrogen fixation protein NifU and related proteins
MGLLQEYSGYQRGVFAMDSQEYSRSIFPLYENPLNWGLLEGADIAHEENNVVCGDFIHIGLQLDQDRRISDVKWSGYGCAICCAAASRLTESIKGMELKEAAAFPPEVLLSILGLPMNRARLQCALLPLEVLKTGIRRYSFRLAKVPAGQRVAAFA